MGEYEVSFMIIGDITEMRVFGKIRVGVCVCVCV